MPQKRQLPELFTGTREAGDEGGPQSQPWDAIHQLLQQCFCVGLGRPVHGKQRQVAPVLQAHSEPKLARCAHAQL